MLSISRQAEKKNLKSLRFTLRNEIKVHSVNEAQISAFNAVINTAVGEKSLIIDGMDFFHFSSIDT